ncbi:MAG: YceI family protein [Deltaproteobacteria bacterium]|nr:YceI family protein [Deltaproteobacteria bacterium]
MHRIARLAVATALLLAPSLAAASSWQIDSAHTSAQFAVRHLMVSTVRGTLGKVTGSVTLDETDVTKSSVTATIDATGIDTREPKRDEHLRSPEFLDTKKFPTITFNSTKVEKIEDGRYQVTGDLTLRGVTKPVVLTVEGSPTPMQDPFGNTKLGGTVKTKIDRQEFGVAWNKKLDAGGLVVGDEVDITIDVELTKAP